MNLSDYFPVERGDAFTKQHFNILLAAMMERHFKMRKFNGGFVSGPSPDPFLVLSANSNSNQNTQDYLAYYYINVVDAFTVVGPGPDDIVYNNPYDRFYFIFLPYEDMFVNGYKVNQGQRKYIWDAKLTSTFGYAEKDVVFSIKDACLYFIKEGKWVKDDGKIVVLNNDIIILRFLNFLNLTVRGIPIFTTNGASTPWHTTSSRADILDTLYYFKHFRPVQWGGLIEDLDGSDLFPTVVATNFNPFDCLTATENAHVFSPYLIYSDDKNQKSSIIKEQNTKVYKWQIDSTDKIKDINGNYLFSIQTFFNYNTVTELFPFILEDYWLSYMLNNLPGLDFYASFILFKNNSFTNPKPSLTASLINAIYYLVDYYKYLPDEAGSGSRETDGGPPACFASGSDSWATLLASFANSSFRQGIPHDCSPICCPGTITCCCNTITSSSDPVGESCVCGYESNGVTAGATVAGDCNQFGFGASTGGSCSISSTNIRWFKTCSDITFHFLQGYDAGGSIRVWLLMDSVLDIK